MGRCMVCVLCFIFLYGNVWPQQASSRRADRRERKRAFSLLRRKQFGRALTLFRSIVRGGGDGAWVRWGMGRACVALRRWQGALVHAREALRFDPSFVRGLTLRAAIQEKLGNRRAAVRDLRRALVLEQDNPWVLERLARLHEASARYRQALVLYRRAQARKPSPWTLYRCGRILARLGRHAEAWSCFRQARRSGWDEKRYPWIQAHTARALYRYAVQEKRAARLEKARKLFLRLARQRPAGRWVKRARAQLVALASLVRKKE